MPANDDKIWISEVCSDFLSFVSAARLTSEPQADESFNL
jgi:hypothetical protein